MEQIIELLQTLSLSELKQVREDLEQQIRDKEKEYKKSLIGQLMLKYI